MWDEGRGTKVDRYRVQISGCRMQNEGCRMQDEGCGMQDESSRIWAGDDHCLALWLGSFHWDFSSGWPKFHQGQGFPQIALAFVPGLSMKQAKRTTQRDCYQAGCAMPCRWGAAKAAAFHLHSPLCKEVVGMPGAVMGASQAATCPLGCREVGDVEGKHG